MRVLLVEDDALLGDGIYVGLKKHGHQVDWVKDGHLATLALQTERFDAVVLDLALPQVSGLELLTLIRAKGNKTPVLILTAYDSVEDRIQGLDKGADDYLAKPFDLDELCARLRALQRRFAARAAPTIEYGDIVLDPFSHTVKVKGEIVNLSRRELVLLQKLLENTGRVLSREYLTQALYGWEEEIDSNTLEVYVHNIRRKLDSKLIRTIRGIGYMIDKKE